LVPELAKSGAIDLDTIFNIMSCKSLSEAKYQAAVAVKKKKKEANEIGQLQQQLQDAQQQL
jgi:hypothetical protein